MRKVFLLVSFFIILSVIFFAKPQEQYKAELSTADNNAFTGTVVHSDQGDSYRILTKNSNEKIRRKCQRRTYTPNKLELY